jgi:hypothetical protein
MIAAVDSSADAPTVESAHAARAAGVRVWGGYLASKPNVGLYAPWQRWQFDLARLCGGMPLAFCSGRDDPRSLRTLAAEWGVRLTLDVEPGIRGDGAWVPAFLEASGAGLYGLLAVHHWPAPFHIMADYPGYDPGRVWLTDVRPDTPLGWQWWGTHQEFGRSVDRLWLDDWFGGGPEMLDPNDAVVLKLEGKIDQALNFLFYGADGNWPDEPYVTRQLKALLAGQTVPAAVDVVLLAAALAPHLPAVVDEAKLALDLEAVLPGADAIAIELALAKALTAGRP